MSKADLRHLEPIRLVIWDLDETFWRGTLSEEGIKEYVLENHTLVVELAKRGIMSSICSKNDFETAKRVLEERGIWDYFVFPSIDWSPKPERVNAIIEAIQLRPSTVMFIDDNPSNRASVVDRIHGIRVEAETFIPEIAEHRHFVGKDDTNLSRLQQYRLLEKRQTEQNNCANNLDFLRQSGIEVEIEIDLEPHYARIVELINRTNQLNFTKNRLSDDKSLAIEQLKTLLSGDKSPENVAGLVRVKDRYGDYGYCGFFLVQWHKVVHFCFSCRILGFGVETWLYQKLKTPEISIEGTVLTDIKSSQAVDWINVSKFGDDTQDSQALALSHAKIGSVAVRGHCEASVIMPYFDIMTPNARCEGSAYSNFFCLPGDSLINIYYSTGARWKESEFELNNLGRFSGAGCKIFENTTPTLVLMFNHRDFTDFIYKHKTKDFAVNVRLDKFWGDLCNIDIEILNSHVKNIAKSDDEYDSIKNAIDYLRRYFRTITYDSAEFIAIQQRCLDGICEEINQKSYLFAPIKHWKSRNTEGHIFRNEKYISHRSLMQSKAETNRQLILIDIADCVNFDDEIIDFDHYSRIVYYRLCKIAARLYAELSVAGT